MRLYKSAPTQKLRVLYYILGKENVTENLKGVPLKILRRYSRKKCIALF